VCSGCSTGPSVVSFVNPEGLHRVAGWESSTGGPAVRLAPLSIRVSTPKVDTNSSARGRARARVGGMSSLQKRQSELLGLSRDRAMTLAEIVTLLGDLAEPLSASVIEVGGVALLREGGRLWVPPESVNRLARQVTAHVDTQIWVDTTVELERAGLVRLVVDEADVETLREHVAIPKTL